MHHIRTVTTASGAKAVQVIRYVQGKRVVVRHIGSAHDDIELDALVLAAQEWITEQTNQLSFFPDSENNNILLLNHCEYLGFYYTFLYDILFELQRRIGYTTLNTALLIDLVTIRIIEPASKMRSLELIENYFGIKYRRQSFYESAKEWLGLKEEIEKQTVRFAEKEFSFDYALLFYDVTTLYFETFESDDLRKPGFSKDNKSQQPQILVALMVTKDGFPVSYEIFPGNTFEGHTVIPLIQSFVKKHNVKTFTVIADAAMLSSKNIQELKKANIRYVVGARLGNVSSELLQQIDGQLPREDGKIIRLTTDHGFLICSFSQQRFKKDKYEMEKQIERAAHLLKHPSKNKKTKFIKAQQEKLELNEALIDKTRILLGVKGYITDIEESVADSLTIIERYHDLYKIEQAFRISKHDLETRPIFHFKEEPIRLHILMCFMALAVSKYIELKTGGSIRKFITECKKITDARLLNTLNQKVVTIRTKIHPSLQEFLDQIGLPH